MIYFECTSNTYNMVKKASTSISREIWQTVALETYHTRWAKSTKSCDKTNYTQKGRQRNQIPYDEQRK